MEEEQRQQSLFQQRLQEAEMTILAEERKRFALVRDELQASTCEGHSGGHKDRQSRATGREGRE